VEDWYWTAMQRHKLYISAHGEDLPEVRDWHWTADEHHPG
jgi:xylulose-5-phosphate/fructose-6-phosphate phosphoketolase